MDVFSRALIRDNWFCFQVTLGGGKVLICVWNGGAQVTALRKIPVRKQWKEVDTDIRHLFSEAELEHCWLITLWWKYTHPSTEFMLWPQMTVESWTIHSHFVSKWNQEGVSQADLTQVGAPSLCCQTTYQGITPRPLLPSWGRQTSGAGASQPCTGCVPWEVMHTLCTAVSL